MSSSLQATLLLAAASLFGGASSASLRWPLDVLRAPPDSGVWEVTWREVSFRGWLVLRDPADNSSTAAATTTTTSTTTTTGAPTSAKPCFPPGPLCADKILVTPEHVSSCPVGQKKDAKGRCRAELGAAGSKAKKKKKQSGPSGKKAVNNKKKNKAQKTKRRKVKKGKKNNAKKQKNNNAKKQ
ncbi:uncharacterized protein LOC134531308 [Bacillus rossius redtenbacheri]|uniref:uncharacterized protein LOC134531308 n=1 Tax=Bacillus rossius redtenbacheri TaxID=93214 RepID=UPI002FDD71B8